MRILILLLMMVTFPALSETVQRNYDKQGNYRGQISHEGSRYYILDKNGNRRGYFQKNGDRFQQFDNNGNPKGYATFPEMQ
jgi:hypothetical protein